MYYSISDFLVGEGDKRDKYYDIKLYVDVKSFHDVKDYNPFTRTLYSYDVEKDRLNLFSKDSSKNLIAKISRVNYSTTNFDKVFEKGSEYRVFSMESGTWISITVIEDGGEHKAVIPNSQEPRSIRSLQISNYKVVISKDTILSFISPCKSIYRFLSGNPIGKLRFEIRKLGETDSRFIDCYNVTYDINVPSVVLINAETFKVQDILEITKIITSTFTDPYPEYILDLKNGTFELIHPYGISSTSNMLQAHDLTTKPTILWTYEARLFVRQSCEIAFNILDDNLCGYNNHFFINNLPVKGMAILDVIKQMLSRIEK